MVRGTEATDRIVCAQAALRDYWALVDAADEVTPAVYRAMVRVVVLTLGRILDPTEPLRREDCPPLRTPR